MRSRGVALLALVLVAGACSSEGLPTSAPSGAPAMAVSSTGAQIITESEIVRQAENTLPTASWVLYNRTAAGAATFIVGPSTVPEGVGSMELSTPGGSDKYFLFNFDYVGEQLADLAELRYSTYRTTGSGSQVTALNIVIDENGPAAGGFATLVFEPVYNLSQSVVANDVWQNWDALSGGSAIWWSTRDLPDPANAGQFIACNPNGANAGTAPCAGKLFVPIGSIIAAYPDATVLGGLGMNQGSGNGGLVAAFDALVVSFGTRVVYDFEPYVTATTREVCKGDGWQQVRRTDGSEFRNQGDCVSYVNTGS